MRYVPRYDLFTRYTAERYAPDPYALCSICGDNIYWPEEEVAWDENNGICHAACMERIGERSGENH